MTSIWSFSLKMLLWRSSCMSHDSLSLQKTDLRIAAYETELLSKTIIPGHILVLDLSLPHISWLRIYITLTAFSKCCRFKWLFDSALRLRCLQKKRQGISKGWLRVTTSFFKSLFFLYAYGSEFIQRANEDNRCWSYNQLLS